MWSLFNLGAENALLGEGREGHNSVHEHEHGPQHAVAAEGREETFKVRGGHPPLQANASEAEVTDVVGAKGCGNRERFLRGKQRTGFRGQTQHKEIQDFVSIQTRCRPSKGRRCIPDVIIWVPVKLIIVHKHDSRNFFPWHHGIITNLVKLIRWEQVKMLLPWWTTKSEVH